MTKDLENLTLIPIGPRFFQLGALVHLVCDEILAAGLRDDLDEQCNTPNWYACIIRDDGNGSFQPGHRHVAEPSEQMREWIKLLAVGLNRQLHFMGHWVVAVVAPREIVAFWRDRDGDCQLAIEFNRATEDEFTREGVDPALKQANMAMVQWVENQKALAATDGQKYRKALGEKPPSTH